MRFLMIYLIRVWYIM